MFLKIRKFHRKTPVLESVFTKVANLLKRDFNTGVSYEISKIFKNTILKTVCERASISIYKYVEAYLGSCQAFINGYFAKKVNDFLPKGFIRVV